MSIDSEIQSVISAPTTSGWLRRSLEQALARDCVDAANDAEVLYELLARRCGGYLSVNTTIGMQP